jgi:hypothetical protein
MANKLKHLQYFAATTDNGQEFGGVIILYKGRYYALSDYEEMSTGIVPRNERMGFGHSEELCTEAQGRDIVTDEDIESLCGDWNDFQTVTKRAALRAIISYRRNNIEVYGYNASFDGSVFEFGCGAVKVDPEDVINVLKALKKLTPEEWGSLSTVMQEIEEQEGWDEAGDLYKKQAEVATLLKMPSYLKTLKK